MMGTVILIVVGIVVFIITMRVPVLNYIVCLGLHVTRIVVLTNYNGTEVSEACAILALFTSVLTLYGFGSSAFDDTRQETGNVLLNPIEGGGYKLCSEVIGDSPLQTFIGSVIYSAIIGFVCSLLVGAVSEDVSSVWVIGLILSIIGIIRAIISVIIAIKNR